MSNLVESLWVRALDARRAARHVAAVSVDTAAGAAYYAAFYAASAVFALQGRAFKKHSALEAAVHRDLVKAGIWSVDLGAAFSQLVKARDVGHYGGSARITHDQAVAALKAVDEILQAVHRSDPKMFPMEE